MYLRSAWVETPWAARPIHLLQRIGKRPQRGPVQRVSVLYALRPGDWLHNIYEPGPGQIHLLADFRAELNSAFLAISSQILRLNQ